MSNEFTSFTSKSVTLTNPLPSVTFAELHKRAGVPLIKRKRAEREVFDLDLKFGGGEDFRSHTLRPGESVELPENFANEVAEAFKPKGDLCGTNPGLAVIRDRQDPVEAVIAALQVAEMHYHTCGRMQLDGVRTYRGHSEAEMERYKGSTYATYFLAIAKEELIREKREEIERGLVEKVQTKRATK